MDFMDELRTCSGIRENFEPVDRTETLTSSSTELDKFGRGIKSGKIMDFMNELRTCSGIRKNFEPVDRTETLTSSSTALDSSAGESKAARSWIS